MRFLLLAVAALSLGAAPAAPNGKSGFDALKKLEGSWKQAKSDNAATYLNLSVISGGSAIMEQLTAKDRSKVSMASMYHLDGDQLVMTHYSAHGNQSRMRATSIAPGKIRFEAYEVLNLKSASAAHVSSVVFSFKDSDHLTQEWTTKDGGKESSTVYELTREYVDTLK